MFDAVRGAPVGRFPRHANGFARTCARPGRAGQAAGRAASHVGRARGAGAHIRWTSARGTVSGRFGDVRTQQVGGGTGKPVLLPVRAALIVIATFVTAGR
ncbi:hypothetical protein [Amycolatopsis thermophila]|uniref:Uncharacterized protein n=1 Tax=Amycolatopsis thermophila TaxID=206084 RepID=A0ABU0EW38_9PSEU|nr:hypothetical protein [Amycolatopsis thermophila]MDQ0379027.1 hypothetical protein [Amycolatopsis thermophila]